MNDLKTKSVEAKKVTTTTTTPKANTSEILKSEVKMLKLETTAEKRLKNLENFQKVCTKYNFLKKKSDELNAYMIGRDGLKENIIIENVEGQDFEISNTLIIGEILDLCQNKLFELVEKAEKEVTEFTI